MTNQDLIAKLNSLKKISPDQNWLKDNRELLLSQISNSGAEKLPVWRLVLIDFSSTLKALSQPAYALGVFVLLLLTGSFFSQQMLAKTKPNDSLYIARILSEKVKLNTTFDGATRDRLAVQFATGHAQDISAMLADPEFNTEANKDQVAKLNDNFQAEINTVKDRISRLPAPVKTPTPAAVINNDSQIIIADNSKDEQGIQLSEKKGEATTLNLSVPTSTLTIGTSTENTLALPEASSTLKNEIVPSVAADKIVDEAVKLFIQKDYTKASDKLKEVDAIIK